MKFANVSAFYSLRRAGLAGIFYGLSLMLITASAGFCFEEDEHYGPRPQLAEKVAELNKALAARHGKDPDKLVLPGLFADRKERRVEVLAEATGLSGGELLEFLIVDTSSSHGYEALLWSYAKPSDVHKALEFIGLKPGAPFNPNAMRFWSSGDRVNVSVTGMPGEYDDVVPIESLIFDTEEDKALPEEGFVFAGSIMVQPLDGSGEKAYAADVYDPKSVASIYNEPAAVLDIPRRAFQSEVYGRQVVNSDMVLKPATMIRLIMEPGATNGMAAPVQAKLSVERPEKATNYVFRLMDSEDKVIVDSPSLPAALEKLVSMAEEGRPPYLTMKFADSIAVSDLHRICAAIAFMETMDMVRIDSPPEGTLYYKSFVPDRSWQKPQGRPSQPWELHLSLIKGKVNGEMVWYEPIWDKDSLEPVFNKQSHKVSKPSKFRARLDDDAKAREKAGKSRMPAVLLVFADSAITHGQLMEYLKPVLKTHTTIYVFAE